MVKVRADKVRVSNKVKSKSGVTLGSRFQRSASEASLRVTVRVEVGLPASDECQAPPLWPLSSHRFLCVCMCVCAPNPTRSKALDWLCGGLAPQPQCATKSFVKRNTDLFGADHYTEADYAPTGPIKAEPM